LRRYSKQLRTKIDEAVAKNENETENHEKFL